LLSNLKYVYFFLFISFYLFLLRFVVKFDNNKK
jgi:hypothetical protein